MSNTVQELPISLLEDFPAHFSTTKEALDALKQDISERGIIQPLVVRPLGEHRYQIISGHNRRKAALAAGYTVLPCIVRQLNDKEAHEAMIASNFRSM